MSDPITSLIVLLVVGIAFYTWYKSTNQDFLDDVFAQIKDAFKTSGVSVGGVKVGGDDSGGGGGGGNAPVINFNPVITTQGGAGGVGGTSTSSGGAGGQGGVGGTSTAAGGQGGASSVPSSPPPPPPGSYGAPPTQDSVNPPRVIPRISDFKGTVQYTGDIPSSILFTWSLSAVPNTISLEVNGSPVSAISPTTASASYPLTSTSIGVSHYCILNVTKDGVPTQSTVTITPERGATLTIDQLEIGGSDSGSITVNYTVNWLPASRGAKSVVLSAIKLDSNGAPISGTAIPDMRSSQYPAMIADSPSITVPGLEDNAKYRFTLTVKQGTSAPQTQTIEGQTQLAKGVKFARNRTNKIVSDRNGTGLEYAIVNNISTNSFSANVFVQRIPNISRWELVITDEETKQSTTQTIPLAAVSTVESTAALAKLWPSTTTSNDEYYKEFNISTFGVIRPAKSYTYYVRVTESVTGKTYITDTAAFNSGGGQSGTLVLAQPSPSGVTGTSVQLNWTGIEVGGGSGIQNWRGQVKYKVSSSSTWTTMDIPNQVNPRNYTLTGLSPGQTYDVQVVMVLTTSSNLENRPSNTIQIQTPGDGVTITSNSRTNSTVTINWTKTAGITSVPTVLIKPNAGSTFANAPLSGPALTAASTSATITGISPGQLYNVKVRYGANNVESPPYNIGVQTTSIITIEDGLTTTQTFGSTDVLGKFWINRGQVMLGTQIGQPTTDKLTAEDCETYAKTQTNARMWSYDEGTSRSCTLYSSPSTSGDPLIHVRGLKKDPVNLYPKVPTHDPASQSTSGTNAPFSDKNTYGTVADVPACAARCDADPKCDAFAFKTTTSECKWYQFKNKGTGNIRVGLIDKTSETRSAQDPTSTSVTPSIQIGYIENSVFVPVTSASSSADVSSKSQMAFKLVGDWENKSEISTTSFVMIYAETSGTTPMSFDAVKSAPGRPAPLPISSLTSASIQNNKVIPWNLTTENFPGMKRDTAYTIYVVFGYDLGPVEMRSPVGLYFRQSLNTQNTSETSIQTRQAATTTTSVQINFDIPSFTTPVPDRIVIGLAESNQETVLTSPPTQTVGPSTNTVNFTGLTPGKSYRVIYRFEKATYSDKTLKSAQTISTNVDTSSESVVTKKILDNPYNFELSLNSSEQLRLSANLIANDGSIITSPTNSQYAEIPSVPSGSSGIQVFRGLQNSNFINTTVPANGWKGVRINLRTLNSSNYITPYIDLLRPTITYQSVTNPDGQITFTVTVATNTKPKIGENGGPYIKLYNGNDELPSAKTNENVVGETTYTFTTTGLPPSQRTYNDFNLRVLSPSTNVELARTPNAQLIKTPSAGTAFTNIGARDIGGFDVGYTTANDSADCASKCAENEDCIASVYKQNTRNCWFKGKFVNDYAFGTDPNDPRDTYIRNEYNALRTFTENQNVRITGTLQRQDAQTLPIVPGNITNNESRKQFYAKECGKVCDATAGCVGFTLTNDSSRAGVPDKCDIYSGVTGFTPSSTSERSYVKTASMPDIRAGTVYMIVSVDYNKSIHIYQGQVGDNVNVVLYGYSENEQNNRWKCYRASNGWFIRNEKSGRQLAMTASGSVIVKDINSTDSNQKWEYDKIKGTLRNVGTGRYMYIASNTDDQQITSTTSQDDSKAKWVFRTVNPINLPPNTTFKLRNIRTNKCLKHETNNRTVTWGCDYSSGTENVTRTNWNYNPTTKQLKSAFNPGMCLDATANDNNYYEIRNCDDNRQEQKWYYDPIAQNFNHTVQGRTYNCLDVTGGNSSDGTYVKGFTCSEDNYANKWAPL